MKWTPYSLFCIFTGLLCVSLLSVKAESASREIAVSDLANLLSTEEGIQDLYAEFATIEGGKRRPWEVASLPENIEKNRYKDLLAFDHSRVVLEKLPGDPFSDYINANYIDGQNSDKEYVATQGPLPNTVDDFWRMIWQLNATKIIMLANVIEHGEVKVAKYWPDTSETYGNITVQKVAEFSIPHLQHVIRTFSVEKLINGKPIAAPRYVRQFHFTGWPDLGVPEDRLSVVTLIRQARMYSPENKAPIVIHCSAGIGRTGTVILMDSMMQKAMAEGIVDFPKRLDHMRTLRPDVVEKKEQYVFAHQAVNDISNVVETQVLLDEVELEYSIIDRFMDLLQLAPPKNLQEILRRLKEYNAIMRLLKETAVEKN